MATFASAGLLGVANGRPSPVAELITDHDLSQIPHLASTHPGATKRVVRHSRSTARRYSTCLETPAWSARVVLPGTLHPSETG